MFVIPSVICRNLEWALAGSRPKRPLSSVVLDRKIKKRIVEDASDFLKSEKWYADRGIPWRRGYLFHGKPGTGKTSLSMHFHFTYHFLTPNIIHF